jgi:dihydroflavonol-4-reductase
VIVNPAVVIGPGDLNRISGDIILQVSRGRVPVAIAGGLNAIHIADVARGHLAAWRGGRRGERYILGSENMTHVRFLALIAEVTGARAPRLVLPTRLVRGLAPLISLLGRRMRLPIHGGALYQAGYYFYYDTRKAEAELGLENRLPVRQAIEEAFGWYREHGMHR